MKNKGKVEDEYYLNDSHIWNAIGDLEKSSPKQFEANKNKLSNYIYALLKFDWERSKRESKISGNIIISFVLFLMSVLLPFVMWLFDNTINFKIIALLSAVCLLLYLFNYIPYMRKTNSDRKNSIYLFALPSIIILIVFIILLLFTNWQVLINGNNDSSNLSFIVFTALYSSLLAILFFHYDKLQDERIIRNYINTLTNMDKQKHIVVCVLGDVKK